MTTEQHRLPELTPAMAHLPVKDQPKIAATIEARIAARTGVAG